MKNELEKFHIKNVIGVDEVGIGCLAGPVVACAVYLDKEIIKDVINYKYERFRIQDSKTIPFEEIRYLMANWLKEKVKYELSIVEVDEINATQNIHLSAAKARANACDKLIEQLGFKPQKILIDGNDIYRRSLLKYSNNASGISIKAIVKGDNKFYSVASASIIAKAFRDTYMCTLSASIPDYEFEKHKGYCTARHIELIRKNGLCEQHRYFANKFLK
jgi:ribonuclease HII